MKKITTFIFLIINGLLVAQSPQLIVQRGHTAPITDMVISAKNDLLATASYDRTIKIWQTSTGKELRTYSEASQDYSPIRLALSEDERFFFASSTGGSLLKFDLLEDKKKTILEARNKVISFLQTHPSQPLVAIGHETGEVILYDYEMEEVVFEWQVGASLIQNIQFGERGRFIFAKAEKGELLAVDLRKEEAKSSFPQNVATFDVSPNGKQLVTVSLDSVVSIFKIKKNERLSSQRIATNCRNIFWENEHQALLINEDFQLEQFDLQNFTTSPVNFNIPRYYALKIKNQQLLFNDGPVLKIVDLNTFQEKNSYQGFVGDVYTSNINAVLFDKNGRNIITGGGSKTVRFWGEYNYEDVSVGFEVKKLKLSEDGKWLLCSGSSKKFHLIDIQKRDIAQTYEGHKKSLMDVAFLENNKIVSVARDKTVKVWSLDSATILQDWQKHQGYIYSLAIHENIIATGDSKGIIYVWNEKTGEVLREIDNLGNTVVQSLAFSDDGKYLYGALDNGQILTLDWRTESDEIPFFESTESKFLHLKTFQDSLFAIKNTTYEASEMAVVALKMEGKTMPHLISDEWESGIYDYERSEDGRLMVSAGYDNVVKLLDVKRRKLLAKIYTLGQDNWAIVTPEGLFDASAGGMERMHYTQLNEAIQLDQLKERYYEPDLLQKLLGYNEEPLRQPSAFKTVALYPKVYPFLRGLDLFVKLEPRGGGIGKVSIFINQKEIIENVNPNQQTSIDIDLKPYEKFLLRDTINKIGVKVYNAEGWLHSQIETVDLEYRPTTSRKLNIKKYEPHFYALIIGTSDYRGETLDLSFADKDAADMANALQLSGTELFGAARTHVHLLNTEQQNDLQPSKSHIQQAFQTIAKQANAEDIFVLYLSGHGVNYGAPNSQFYYLTKEIASEELGDESIRNNYTMSSQEFTAALNKISAQKQIMILDACSSGSLVENMLTQSRSLSSSQKRALDRMKDRAGVFILAGSAANKVSYEASQFGQGLLTYSLLSGMRGGALRENEFVDVMQLFQYAADKVPELAAVIGGVQRPVIAAPTSTNSFDIGQVTDSVRYKIPLEEVKPLFIKSNFQHETFFEDVLDLSDLVDRTFQGLSNDSDASILFINVKKYPKAYSIKGRYETTNGGIKLIAKLFQDGQAIGNIEATAANEEELMERILEKVVVLIE